MVCDGCWVGSVVVGAGRIIIRPYSGIMVDDQDAMDVVWHNDEFVQGDMGMVLGDLLPVSLGGVADRA